MDPIQVKEWYTVDDAARQLGVKAETVKTYLRQGSLKGVKVGPRKQWQVPGSELVRKRREWNLT